MNKDIELFRSRIIQETNRATEDIYWKFNKSPLGAFGQVERLFLRRQSGLGQWNTKTANLIYFMLSVDELVSLVWWGHEMLNENAEWTWIWYGFKATCSEVFFFTFSCLKLLVVGVGNVTQSDPKILFILYRVFHLK